MSHRTAPVHLRERFAIPEEALSGTAMRARAVGCRESFVLSTCNRVELYAAVDAELVAERLPEVFGADPESLGDHLYLHRGEAAVRHLFRVAASLDSMVVGEPQILGQMKAAYDLCREAGLTGPAINRTVSRAFSVAKRVRNETGIGRHVVSISSVAVDLARQIFGDLLGRAALLVGAGKMGELAARHLKNAGVAELLVANRSFERARKLASTLGGLPRDLSELPNLLVQADIVITSTGARHHLIERKMMSRVLRQRKYRPIFLIDIAVPRNVEPGVNGLDNVFLYDVDDLQAIAEANLESRRREAESAESMVQVEAQRYVREVAGQAAKPTIVAVREKVHALKQVELERTLAHLPDLSPKERQAVERLADGVANKLLHSVMMGLKRGAAGGDVEVVRAARLLFDLDNDP